MLRMYPLTPLWRADPYLSVPQNHSDSPMALFEGDDFQGCRFEHSDDYPSLPSMGWASRDWVPLKSALKRESWDWNKGDEENRGESEER